MDSSALCNTTGITNLVIAERKNGIIVQCQTCGTCDVNSTALRVLPGARFSLITFKRYSTRIIADIDAGAAGIIAGVNSATARLVIRCVGFVAGEGNIRISGNVKITFTRHINTGTTHITCFGCGNIC